MEEKDKPIFIGNVLNTLQSECVKKSIEGAISPQIFGMEETDKDKDRYGIYAFIQRTQQQRLIENAIENAIKNAMRSCLHTDTSTAGGNPDGEPDFYTAIAESRRLTDEQKERAKKYFPRLIDKGYIKQSGRKYVWNRTRAQAGFVISEIFKGGDTPNKILTEYFENLRRIGCAVCDSKAQKQTWQAEYMKEIFFD